jgi:hypothetical protein
MWVIPAGGGYFFTPSAGMRSPCRPTADRGAINAPFWARVERVCAYHRALDLVCRQHMPSRLIRAVELSRRQACSNVQSEPGSPAPGGHHPQSE